MHEEITPTLQPGQDSTLVVALRAGWEKGEFADLSAPLQLARSGKQAADLVISEQFYRWKAGDHKRIASYVETYPSLRSDKSALLEMVRAEIVLRREHQEAPTSADYESSFPELSNEIHRLLDSRSELTAADATLGIAEARLWAPRSKALAADAPQIAGYELIEELGRGGMGVVFRAKQLLADREVALKIIRPDSLALLDPVARNGVIRRFSAEARAAARLNHDHIVTVYDIGECRGFHYYTMKLVDGPSLSNLLREKPLDDRAAARYCMEASLGVHAAHERGILHRDLKPSNVMLERGTNRALVADFGLAKIASEGREQLTHSGDVVGTPAYMPPEQAKDSSTVTAQSDVYSLGATLYHAITGRPPFQAASLGEILRQIADEEPISPRRMNQRINRDLETICLKAMQKSPAQRYATAKEFADDLRRFLEGRPILARPVSRPEAIWRWCRRNPQLASAIATATTLAVLAIGSIIVGYIRTSAELANSKRRLEKSLSLVDELFTKVSEDDLLNEPGMQVMRKQLLERARTHYNELLEDSGNLPIARKELAAAHYRFGKISFELGDTEIASRELAIAEREQREMLRAEPDLAELQVALANTLLGNAQVRQAADQYDEMTAIFREALELRISAAASAPQDLELKRLVASARMNLGTTLRDSGEIAQAERELIRAQNERERILAIDAQQVKAKRDLAQGAYNLALLYLRMNDEKEDQRVRQKAIEQFGIAVSQFTELSKLQPRVQSHRFNLANTLKTLASIDDNPEADYSTAADVLTGLVEDNPEVVEYRIEAGALELDRGVYLQGKMRTEDAIAAFGKCSELLSSLAESKAAAAELLAMCLMLRGESFYLSGKPQDAIKDLKTSADWWKALLEQTADDAYLQGNLKKAEALLAKASRSPDSAP